MKTSPVEIIRPSKYLSSLEKFNECVLMLVQAVDMTIQHGLNEVTESNLKDHLDKVKLFYPQD